jgi:hypothetical protein
MTLYTKLLVVTEAPSLTLSVMTELAVAPARGLSVRVRAAPLPPSTTFSSGTIAAFDDVTDTMRLLRGLSTSSTENARGADCHVRRRNLIDHDRDRGHNQDQHDRQGGGASKQGPDQASTIATITRNTRDFMEPSTAWHHPCRDSPA